MASAWTDVLRKYAEPARPPYLGKGPLEGTNDTDIKSVERYLFTIPELYKVHSYPDSDHNEGQFRGIRITRATTASSLDLIKEYIAHVGQVATEWPSPDFPDDAVENQLFRHENESTASALSFAQRGSFAVMLGDLIRGNDKGLNLRAFHAITVPGTNYESEVDLCLAENGPGDEATVLSLEEIKQARLLHDLVFDALDKHFNENGEVYIYLNEFNCIGFYIYPQVTDATRRSRIEYGARGLFQTAAYGLVVKVLWPTFSNASRYMSAMVNLEEGEITTTHSTGRRSDGTRVFNPVNAVAGFAPGAPSRTVHLYSMARAKLGRLAEPSTPVMGNRQLSHSTHASVRSHTSSLSGPSVSRRSSSSEPQPDRRSDATYQAVGRRHLETPSSVASMPYRDETLSPATPPSRAQRRQLPHVPELPSSPTEVSESSHHGSDQQTLQQQSLTAGPHVTYKRPRDTSSAQPSDDVESHIESTPKRR